MPTILQQVEQAAKNHASQSATELDSVPIIDTFSTVHQTTEPQSASTVTTKETNPSTEIIHHSFFNNHLQWRELNQQTLISIYPQPNAFYFGIGFFFAGLLGLLLFIQFLQKLVGNRQHQPPPTPQPNLHSQVRRIEL